MARRKKDVEGNTEDNQPDEETSSMPSNNSVDPEIIKGVAEALKPHMVSKINELIQPLRDDIASVQSIVTKELKEIMNDIKGVPPTGRDSFNIPKGVNEEDLKNGKTIDPMFNPGVGEQPKNQQPQKPNPSQGFDLNKLMGEAMKDPQIGPMLNSLGMGGGQSQQPQGSPVGIPTPQPMNIPDFSNMSEEQKKFMQQQQTMQMLPMLLQSILPLLQQGQGGGFMQELMMRKFMSDMSFNEHMNRGMMNWWMKTVMKDPSQAEGYNDASMRYMSPVADPGLYQPPNYPQQGTTPPNPNQQNNGEQPK